MNIEQLLEKGRLPRIAPNAGWRFLAVLTLVTAAGGACAGRPAWDAAGPPRAELLGAWAGWTGALPEVEGLRVGSLSALAFDPASRRWIAAPDDITNQRLIWFDVSAGPALVVTPAAVTRLTAGPTAPPDVLTALDIEGAVRFPDGSFALSHEGHIDRARVARQPRVILATAAGVLTQVVTPRPRFAIDPDDPTHGVRHNLGLEALARTPDGRLVAGLEQPLAQDGPISSAREGGLVRLAEFVERGGRWRPGREWAYRLDPTPRVAGYTGPCQDGQNGLSGMAALSDTTFLAVERACLVGPPGSVAYNPVRIYEVSVAGADDVAALDSLAGRTPRPARKRLVVDLADWIPRLPEPLKTLSNFEGIALGPPDAGGRPTVMIVSDDNFRATQTTAFVWFALVR